MTNESQVEEAVRSNLKWVPTVHTRIIHAVEREDTNPHTGGRRYITWCGQREYDYEGKKEWTRYECGRCLRVLRAHWKQIIKRGVISL